MSKNICCPFLTIIDCQDTDEHAHLFCDFYQSVNDGIIDNEYVIEYCLKNFEECRFIPSDNKELN